MATDFERLIEQIEALPQEQKCQLVRRLEQDGFFGDQSWYWTPEWQSAEKEADDDIAAGRVHSFGDVEDAIMFLHREAGIARIEEIKKQAHTPQIQATPVVTGQYAKEILQELKTKQTDEDKQYIRDTEEFFKQIPKRV